MEHVFTVKCPNCGVEDSTNVLIDELTTIYITTVCVECTNPYVMKLEPAVTVSCATLNLSADKETFHA